MFGFILGTLGLVGVGMMLRRRRYAACGYGYGPTYGAAYGPGCGHHVYGWGHHGHGWGHHGHGWEQPGGPWHGGGPGWAHGDHGSPRGRGRWWRGGLALALRRLRVTPEQEAVIREALDELWTTTQPHREEWAATRRDVADAVRGESFDATTMGELFGRHDERLAEIRKAVVGALGRIHAVLDESQRQQLAQMLDRGRGGWHPFRGDDV